MKIEMIDPKDAPKPRHVGWEEVAQRLVEAPDKVLRLTPDDGQSIKQLYACLRQSYYAGCNRHAPPVRMWTSDDAVYMALREPPKEAE